MADLVIAKPPFDPTAILTKLKGIVDDHKSSSSSPASWVDTLIVIAVVLATTAIWTWVSSRNNAELARLRHDREVQRIQAEKAAVDAKVAANDTAITAAQKQIDAAQEQLKHIQADIQAQEDRYAADMRAVDSIRSWRDLDPRAS